MQSRHARVLIAVLLLVVMVILWVRKDVLAFLWHSSSVASAVAGLGPSFEAPLLAEDRLEVALDPVAEDLAELTDIQFPPGRSDVMVALQKAGRASAITLSTGERRTVLERAVRTESELGLLGWAFHPRWPEDPRVFVNYNPADGTLRTRISSLRLDPATWQADDEQVLLEIDQPYANHDGGQLQFGPDGMLYVGMGDGGAGGDPQGHGQDVGTLLGALLRLDVDSARPYAVPADNPFLGVPGARPELWAIGLRNPWRFSFDPSGRAVVADVGQNAWEEVSLVAAGDNLGWKVREASHCFPPGETCSADGFVEPIFEYGHEAGRSITGGYVQLSAEVPGLQGRYLVGDFVSGRLWALDLPAAAGQPAGVVELGRWRMNISTFGRDGDGRVYVGSYRGTVYRVAAP